MLTQKMESALNAQINAELWSAYLYLSMSADFAAKGLPGFANWMYVQFTEEQEHAMRIFKYIVSRGGRPLMEPIAAVDQSWKSPLHAFEDTLKHEKVVTGMIHQLYGMASEEKDYATVSMLKWFVDEQVEEEEVAQGLVDALKLIDGNNLGIYQLDKELASRK